MDLSTRLPRLHSLDLSREWETYHNISRDTMRHLPLTLKSLNLAKCYLIGFVPKSHSLSVHSLIRRSDDAMCSLPQTLVRLVVRSSRVSSAEGTLDMPITLHSLDISECDLHKDYFAHFSRFQSLHTLIARSCKTFPSLQPLPISLTHLGITLLNLNSLLSLSFQMYGIQEFTKTS